MGRRVRPPRRNGLGRDGGVNGKPDSLAIIQSRAALRRWCILAGLALAPMPIIYAMPSTFLYVLFDSPVPVWVRITTREPYLFAMLGLPLTAIFLAWSLPGAGRPGVPLRSIVVLCLLVAYNPLQSYFENHLLGETVARIAGRFSRESPLIWSIRHLDTPLLIGLATTALLRRHTLPPYWKVLFHWNLFVCALWAAGHPYDYVFVEILVHRALGI